jgi:hypothetical protein
MIKRSELLNHMQDLIGQEGSAKEVLSFLEKYLEPRLRPLTNREVEDHVLVKQVHHSKKDEVRLYVKNLDYEWKREYISEED